MDENMENTTSVFTNKNNSYVSLTEDEILDWMTETELKRYIPIIIFLCIIVITGVLGNGHVCYIYWPTYDTTAAKLFVFFIGVNDLLFSGITVPADLVFIQFPYNFPNEGLCEVWTVLVIWLTLCMATGLVAVAVDRYRVVCTPTGWQITLTRAAVICVIITAVSLVCSLCIPILNIRGISTTNLTQYNVTISQCVYQASDVPLTSLKFWYVVCGMTLFVGGLITICVMNFLIAIRLFQQSREAGRIYEDEELDSTYFAIVMERSKEEIILNARARKETKCMIIVSVAILVSYLPAFVSMIIRNAEKDFLRQISHGERIVIVLFQQSFKLNCVINPAIYWKFNSHFRKECRRLLPGILNNCAAKLRRK